MKSPRRRFGSLTIEEADVLTFVDGLIGMEDCRRWVLLGDAENRHLAGCKAWSGRKWRLGVVSPRRFVPDYQVRVAKREIAPLGLENPNDAQVLVIVSNTGGTLALNLKAPLVIHLAERSAGRLSPAMIMRCSIGSRRQRGERRRRRQMVSMSDMSNDECNSKTDSSLRSTCQSFVIISLCTATTVML